MDAAARRQCLFAIGHNLVPILEPFAHLHVTIEVGSAELDRGEMQITIHDLPDTNFVALTLDGSVGDQWSGRERRQVNRDFGQFTHRWQRFWFVIECHLGKRFLGYRVGLGFHPQHATFQGLATTRTQDDMSRQPPSQPRCADLVEAHIDPQTLGVDHFHHGLARDDGRAGIGIAHGDYTVDRRDQAQIAPLRDECFAVGACPGNIFPSGG